MMEKFMGKSPASTSNPIPIDEPSVSCKMVSGNNQNSGSNSPKEDPFLDLNVSFIKNDQADSGKADIDSDVETAVEADENIVFDVSNEQDTISNLVEAEVEEMKPEPPQSFIGKQSVSKKNSNTGVRFKNLKV